MQVWFYCCCFILLHMKGPSSCRVSPHCRPPLPSLQLSIQLFRVAPAAKRPYSTTRNRRRPHLQSRRFPAPLRDPHAHFLSVVIHHVCWDPSLSAPDSAPQDCAAWVVYNLLCCMRRCLTLGQSLYGWI